jgi:NitT/TauT family transport system permease protein
MSRLERIFYPGQNLARRLTPADAVLLVAVAATIGLGVKLAQSAPETVSGPNISLDPGALPVYAVFSLGRMAAAYTLSLLFSIVYGYTAAGSKRAERVLLPILDVLQSVPILSFLPVVLLGLTAILPEKTAAELASILLIFTSQAWNLTFSWYQSLTTIPKELKEATRIFGLNNWLTFKSLQLPFGAIGLIWNSIMSWAGGWFFLMAAEIFHLGKRDFRLPGLGSYLQEAANKGDLRAIGMGLLTLCVVIVALDQLIWRPLLAWSDRFRLDMVGSDSPPTSWFHEVLMNSHLMRRFRRFVIRPVAEKFDARMLERFPVRSAARTEPRRRNYLAWILPVVAFGAGLFGIWEASGLLARTTPGDWLSIVVGLAATFLRVALALVLALAWTIPVGVAIGTNAKLARWLQPITQLAASLPATALFPIFLLGLLSMGGGLNVAAILLMMAGTQWYLLFNVIAGASSIPQDLKHTSALMHLRKWDRWKLFILPSLFPYIVTGSITASGGAWNASIVAEYVEFHGEAHETVGIGASIALATKMGNFPLLLSSTLCMVLTVVMINRFVWRRLYKLAEDRFRMD